MSRPVPEGWKKAALSEIAEIAIGGTPSRREPAYWDRDKETQNIWVSISDLKGREIIETEEYISDLGVKKSNVKLVPPGTLLMSFKLTLGRVAIAGIPLYTNEAIAAFHIKENEVYRDFLFYVLPDASNAVESDQAVKGKTLNKAKLNELKILLPPLPEQQKIAEILGSVDAAIDATRAVITQTRRTQKALMEELLTKGLPGKGTKHWKAVLVDDVLERIDAGKSPNCEGRPATLDEWGVLKVSAVSWEQFKPEENKVLPKSFKPIPELEVKSNDLIISRANTVDLVGAVVLVHKTRSQLMLCDKTLRLVPKGNILREYLLLTLRSKSAREWLESEATGTSKSMKNISQKTIREIKFLLPPLDEQHVIAQNYQNAQDRLTQEVAWKNALENIKSALMQVLLTGEKRVVLKQPEGVAV